MTTTALDARFRGRSRSRRFIVTVGPATFTFTAQLRYRAERSPVSHEDLRRIEAAHRDTLRRMHERMPMGPRIP